MLSWWWPVTWNLRPHLIPLEPFTPCVSVGWSSYFATSTSLIWISVHVSTAHHPLLSACGFSRKLVQTHLQKPGTYLLLWESIYLRGDPCPDCDGLSSPSLWTEHFCLKWENLLEHKVGYCVY